MEETWEVSRQDISQQFQQEGVLAEEILQQVKEEMLEAIVAYQEAQETTIESMRAVHAAPVVRTAAVMYLMNRV